MGHSAASARAHLLNLQFLLAGVRKLQMVHAVHQREELVGALVLLCFAFVNGFLDLLSAAFISTSALKPLHVFGRIGGVCLLVGGGISLWFFGQWVVGTPMRTRPLMLIGGWLLLTGLQFILMGLLGEMIAHMRAHADYPVRRRYNLDDPA